MKPVQNIQADGSVSEGGPESSHTSSRRSFIIRSLFAAGAVGTGFYLSRSSYASGKGKGEPKDFRVRLRYPWYVDVNGDAQATMYLLEGLIPGQAVTLGNLLGYTSGGSTVQWPLVDTNGSNGVVNKMKERADELAGLDKNNPNGNQTLEETAAEMTRAINENNSGATYQLGELRDRLQAVITAVSSLDPADPYRTYGYVDYAKHRVRDWPLTVYQALHNLSSMITVPILHTDAYEVTRCYVPVANSWRSKKLSHLFIKQRTDLGEFDGQAELDYWWRIQALGLLWCGPRPVKDDCSPQYVDLQETGNGRRCNSSHKCETGNADDYCQEVDGVCNAMS